MMRWPAGFQVFSLGFSYLFAVLVGIAVDRGDGWMAFFCACWAVLSVLSAASNIARRGWLWRRA